MRLNAKPSLLWKILLSASIAITLLLAGAGWLVQNQTRAVLSENLQSSLRGSFRAYESLWKARTEMLRSVSLVLSSMSDVRAAFQTRDGATIRDTAAEIWSKISSSSALFLVTDPRGGVIASLGGEQFAGGQMNVVADAAERFPAQTSGFAVESGRLYEFVVTPVYVQTSGGQGLLNVLVAGFPVDAALAAELKQQTGGSDFMFLAGGKPIASTLNSGESDRIASFFHRGAALQRIDAQPSEFAVLGSPLLDMRGAPAGDLLIIQDYAGILSSLEAMQRKLLVIWIGAVLAGLALSALLAHSILKPVRQLDEAASRIARQEYSTRVPEVGNDELGRLAQTFNSMCASIQDARSELIRQERILTIGRLSSSIVHDLRNPLASIYGGAEMMVDGNLSDAQMQRIAGNIYRSSRAINDLLQELVDVSRGRMQTPELCRLADIVDAAVDAQSAVAGQNGVAIHAEIDPAIDLPLERARMERVFLNLISNAIEAMPAAGSISIYSSRDSSGIVVSVDDTGPGIPPAIRSRLFQPFVTDGKNGMGLGLALARQTVLDHGGDLWLEEGGAGAHFRLRLPSPSA